MVGKKWTALIGHKDTEVADPDEHRNQTSGSTHYVMFLTS
jgi:hypothetical protein